MFSSTELCCIENDAEPYRRNLLGPNIQKLFYFLSMASGWSSALGGIRFNFDKHIQDLDQVLDLILIPDQVLEWSWTWS